MTSSWSVEVETKAPPVPLFKATFNDWNNLGPKLLPDIIASVTVLSGHGAAGSTRRINYTPAVPYEFVTERLEAIDHEKLELWVSLVEGGDIGTKLESANSHIKVEGKGDGSVVKLEATQKVLPGKDVSEEIEKVKQGFIRSIKAVEEYLLANPGSYA
ncbi:hypothetical protein KSP39_PZI006828 [Platanthera zijinensis]|uniref:Bet v I/Major latex protein domain-containing protein n=1 Tax=Platanthera zijinensis TaxID=2320716 RepID=A0AAP0BRE3_9ASPA